MSAPSYFASPKDFRAWLARHHASERSLLVGFHKTKTGVPSLSWSESVDEALCFGWIDGVRRRVDDERYSIRFTPRKPGSIWSLVNVKKLEALQRAGRVSAAGRAAFEARKPERVGVYSHENGPQMLPAVYRRQLDAHPVAAADFDARAPSYRRASVWWVVSAKAEATRARRLAQLIALHAVAKALPQFERRVPARPAARAPAPDDASAALRAFGLTYPGAHRKSPWPGHDDLAVNDKTFAYLSEKGAPFSIGCKLPGSGRLALMLPFCEPMAWGLGKSGWVTAKPPAGTAIPVELFKQWIDESYRAQAPKRLLKQLDDGAGAPVAKKRR